MTNSHDTLAYTVRAAARSHRGLIRPRNEDRYSLSSEDSLFFRAAVFDGMGGMPGGAEAASAAATLFDSLVFDAEERLSEKFLSNILARLNAAVLDMTVEQPQFRNAGTTVAALFLDRRSGDAWVVHAGDSRILHVRDGKGDWITVDHNVAEDLIATENVSKGFAYATRDAFLLTSCLGLDPFPGGDIRRVQVRNGDRFLLCTDGVSGLATKAVLARYASIPDIDAALEELEAHLLQAGSPDNITAILVDLRCREKAS